MASFVPVPNRAHQSLPRQQQQQEDELILKQQEEEVVSSHHDGCDESKCVSLGLSDKNNGSSSFTCYTDGGGNYPMMCADRYEPRLVKNESSLFQDKDIFAYYTCCPPDLSPETNVVRHCSNPITTTNSSIFDHSSNATVLCEEDEARPYTRQMKNPSQMDDKYLNSSSYVCCDSAIVNDDNSNSKNDFLDVTECVPYRNRVYENALIQNTCGKIFVRECDLDGGFNFSHIATKNSSNYECCKTDYASEPFLKDSAFKMTVYPQIVVSSIGVICCLVIILGLLVPFVVGIENTQNTSRWGNGNPQCGRGGTTSTKRSTAGPHTRGRTRGRQAPIRTICTWCSLPFQILF